MSSRKTLEGIYRVYEAAQEWVNRALRDDDSLFTPEEAIWSRKCLTELYSRYREGGDSSIGSFYPRLEKILEGSPPEVHQLMAEILYFHMLIRSSNNATGKRNKVNQVLAWSGQGICMPEELENTLTPGVANIGPALANLDDFLGFLIEFVARWKEENSTEQRRLLDDPWAFKDFTRDENLSCELFQPHRHTIQRHALLHLVFPDTFEPIVSDNHKSKLTTRMGVGSSETDPDRIIYEIRADIEKTLGRDFDFYDNDAIRWWDPFERGYGPPYGLPADVSTIRKPLPDPWSPDNIGRLAKDLLWEPDHLQRVIDDLKKKRQVIFYGPPGTGKTYAAREIAKQSLLNGGDFEIVQFHPSYSYEDFVQGFRPRLFDGQPGFQLEPGPLHRIAEAARKDESATFVLVIDELNRGNVAKVFGELYFLLEYRNEEVQLQYGMGSRFSLPPNLWFICTMNTSDRSIALMDAALRRRFFFTPFFSDEPPVKDLLRRWLKREGHGAWVADLVDSANGRLDRDMGIGPSYFMTTGDLDEERVRRIWRRSILPYIEDQFFGDADKLAEFNLDRLIAQLAKATEEADQDG